ncbi:MAG: hypothetical protein ABJF01_15930 [bacterium]
MNSPTFMPTFIWWRTATLGAVSCAIAGCSDKPAGEQSDGGSIDTAVVATTAAMQAAGPGVHVTRTDGKSVTKALQFELTEENFTRFMAAADSIATLGRRDPTVRAFLGRNFDDAGADKADAGLKWLESNTAVSQAITSTGMMVRDYFIQSIAIASAERFINDPNAAPPTPSLAENAEFLHARSAELAKLQALRENKPAVTSTP